MENYQLKNDLDGRPAGVVRLSDNANIPAAPGNRDWEAYQQWLTQGNTPVSAD